MSWSSGLAACRSKWTLHQEFATEFRFPAASLRRSALKSYTPNKNGTQLRQTGAKIEARLRRILSVVMFFLGKDSWRYIIRWQWNNFKYLTP